MTQKGHATEAMLNFMAKSAFYKIKDWFEVYTDEPFCYWGKDCDFLPASATDQQKQDFMKKHPEIDDLNDHTIVQFDACTQTVHLSKFCPRLKQGLQDLVDVGKSSNSIDGMIWRITPDSNTKDNFRILCYENN